jgi:hypothetical protein
MIYGNRLRRKEAAAYVSTKTGAPMSPATLAKLAVLGGGPEFRRFGRVPIYEVEGLDRWVESKLTKPMRSTSEVGVVGS